MTEPRDSGSPRLSIGALSRATGIPIETLRTWERRYGFPESERRPSGHRRYPLSAVARLRQVAAALAAGHRPSEVMPLAPSDMDSLLLRAPAVPGKSAARAGTSAARGPAARGRAARAMPTLAEMLEATERLDGIHLRLALESAAALQPPLAFLEQILNPLMVEVGARWERGTLEVRHEHFATATAAAVLVDLRRRHEGAAGPHVAMALLPGDRHELGLLMAGVVFASSGWRVVYLGPETPVEQLLALGESGVVDALAISRSATAPRTTRAGLRRLARELPARVALLAGGAGAPAGGARVQRFESLSELARWAAGRRLRAR